LFYIVPSTFAQHSRVRLRWKQRYRGVWWKFPPRCEGSAQPSCASMDGDAEQRGAPREGRRWGGCRWGQPRALGLPAARAHAVGGNCQARRRLGHI